MPLQGYFIDASLLVLLVVGSVDRRLISKHRRLREFAAEDFDLLLRLIDRADKVLVTPNTLTETSNLLAHHADPERQWFFDKLRVMIHESEEIVIRSETAASNTAFGRLGLADAALLEVVTAETPLVTVDLGLFLAASSQEPDSAVNFTTLRDL